MGAHSSRGSSSTSPRSERASVRQCGVKHIHNSLTMYIIILLLFFFVGSVVIFTFVTFLYFFPFSLPPPLEMSQWRFLQSLIVIVHCQLYIDFFGQTFGHCMGGVVVRRRTIRRFWGLGRAPVYRGWENRNFVRPISVAFFPSMLPRTWSFSQSSWLPDRVRALRSGG